MVKNFGNGSLCTGFRRTTIFQMSICVFHYLRGKTHQMRVLLGAYIPRRIVLEVLLKV